METSNERADDGSTHRSRRQVLAAAGGLGASVVAGCLGSGDDGSSTGDGDESDATPTSEVMDGDPGTSTAVTGGAEDGTGTSMEADTPTDTATQTPRGTTAVPVVQGEEPTPASDTAWRSVEFSPVRRDETLTVDGFDRPVVLEAFAVWCPICTEQQNELRGLDDSVVNISINVDPNEDAATVRKHANDNSYDWRYVVAPPEMIRSLVNALGTTVTNAPSTPIVVACPGGGSSFFAGRRVTGVPTIEATAGNC
jgi:hypothetical protein